MNILLILFSLLFSATGLLPVIHAMPRARASVVERPNALNVTHKYERDGKGIKARTDRGKIPRKHLAWNAATSLNASEIETLRAAEMALPPSAFLKKGSVLPLKKRESDAGEIALWILLGLLLLGLYAAGQARKAENTKR